MRKMEIPVCLETPVCARSNRDLAHFFPQRVYVRSGKSLKIVCVFVGPLSLQLRMFANKSASARPRTPAPICVCVRTCFWTSDNGFGEEVIGSLPAHSSRLRWNIRVRL